MSPDEQHGHHAQLPPELVPHIVSFLDPTVDESTLISLMRVSTAFWEIAARSLFKDFTLKTSLVSKRLRKLFTNADGQLGERTRRALAFIEHLHIVSPLRHGDLYLLWDAAASVPNVALFPRVRQLSITDYKLNLPPHYVIPDPDNADHVGARLVPEAALLFNTPDVCCTGMFAYEQLICLPSKKLGAVDVHRVQAEWVLHILQDNPLRDSKSLRIFDDLGGRFWSANKYSIARWEETMADDDPEGRLPKAQLCFREFGDLTPSVLQDLKEWGWEPSGASRFQLDFYPSRTGEGCPPCVVCERPYDNYYHWSDEESDEGSDGSSDGESNADVGEG